MKTTRRSLVVLAALAWISGGIVLLAKGSSLAIEVFSQSPTTSLGWLAPVIGIAVGLLKIKYLFNRFCLRNLDRIAKLDDPRVWQFFRPQFFLFLGVMILLGATLTPLAQGNFPLAIFVIALDFSLATALLGSSLVFRASDPFARQ